MSAGEMKEPVPDLICDIGRSGRLLDFGLDPFTRGREALDACVQTEDRIRRTSLGRPPLVGHAGDATQLPGGKSPPAAQVLRLVVGLLGLEVHAKPKSGSEAWLTFQDTTNSKLGLGGGTSIMESDCPDSPSSPSSKSAMWGTGSEHQTAQQMEWQMRVLWHLRKHFAGAADADSTSVQPIRQAGGSGEKLRAISQVCKDDTGPDFTEHLEIAEHVLKRITHAVTVLQDPERQDRPIVLREYTEKMVLDVCQDLKQWLEQLATIISLYHVHILDLENDRCRLQRLLEEQQAKCAESVGQRKDAVLRHDVLKEKWEEHKMRSRAEALLGISLDGPDEKLYTQKDVDGMFKEWEMEHVEPLLQELRELRAQREAKKKSGGRVVQVSGSLSPEAVATLVQALNALGERLPDSEMGDAVERLADAVCNGGAELEAALRMIERLPAVSSPSSQSPKFVMKGDTQRALAECLSAVGTEFDMLASRSRATPELRGLGLLATWAKDTLSAAKLSLQADGDRSLEWSQAPSWDLESVGRRQSRNTSVNTGVTSVAPTAAPTTDPDVVVRLKKLLADLEARLRDALAQAESWKKKWEEAMQKMADESAKADQLMADLRKRMQDMENIMQQSGAGKQAADAILRSGLSEFMQGRDVFERLYRDALSRMRRLAEAQARIFEETSDSFLRNLASLSDIEALMAAQNSRPREHAREDGSVGRSPPPPGVRSQPPGSRLVAGPAGSVPISDGMPLQVLRLGHDRPMDIRTNQVQLRPLPVAVTRDCWADAGVLPPLECRGRPVGNSPMRSVSPAGLSAVADGCERKDAARLVGGPRSRSPPREEPAPEPAARAAEPPLSIGPLGGVKALGVGQPLERPRKSGSGGGGGRPSTSGSGRLGRSRLRSSGNSMPHLGQPRLLVHSIGMAH